MKVLRSFSGSTIYFTALRLATVCLLANLAGADVLTPVQTVFDASFQQPFSVAVSPDGAHVYVASLNDHAVAVFARDGTTGALAFVEAQFDGA